MWVKFIKTFQGGRGIYFEFIPDKDLIDPKTRKEVLDNYCNWVGENTSGGHNYGWNVKCEECNPDYQDLIDLVKKKQAAIKCVTDQLDSLREELAFYGEELKKLDGVTLDGKEDKKKI